MLSAHFSSAQFLSRNAQLQSASYAWAKLVFLRDAGPTEVGAFGIADADDLLHVQDIVLVRQSCIEVFVAFDDAAVADFFEDQIHLGRRPDQVGQIWIHTHPGDSPRPSCVDVETFERVLGHCDWAVMFILAKNGATHAELHWRQGGPARIRLDVEIVFSRPFSGSDQANWQAEYVAAVHDQRARCEPPQESAAIASDGYPADQESLEMFPDWFAFDDVIR